MFDNLVNILKYVAHIGIILISNFLIRMLEQSWFMTRDMPLILLLFFNSLQIWVVEH